MEVKILLILSARNKFGNDCAIGKLISPISTGTPRRRGLTVERNSTHIKRISVLEVCKKVFLIYIANSSIYFSRALSRGLFKQ